LRDRIAVPTYCSIIIEMTLSVLLCSDFACYLPYLLSATLRISERNSGQGRNAVWM